MSSTPFVNEISLPTDFNAISPPTSSVKLPESEIVESFIVISSTVKVVNVPNEVMFPLFGAVKVSANDVSYSIKPQYN